MRAEEGSTGVSGRFSGALVGREREVSEGVSTLSAALARCCPVMLCYWAPSGTGKTGLVHGMASRMPDTDFLMVDAGPEPGIGPFASAVRNWFGIRGDPVQSGDGFHGLFDGLLASLELRCGKGGVLWRDFRRLRDSLEELSGLRVPAGEDTDGMKYRTSRLAEAFSTFASVLSTAVRPVVVVLENLQWFSRTDLRMASRLIEASQGRAISFIATSRPGEDGGEPGFPSGPSLHERRITRLDGISRESLCEFVREYTGREPGDDLAELLWDRAGGIPLLLIHSIEYLGESGALLEQKDRIELCLDVPGLPESMEDLLAARMDILPPGLSRMLRTAAVLGDGITPSALARVSGSRIGAEMLDTAVELRFLDVRDGSYRFAHPVLRREVLRTVTDAELLDLHASAAAFLDAETDRDAAMLEVTGDHYLLAGDTETALERLGEAASLYGEECDFEAAIGVYRRILPLLQDPERSRRLLEMVTVQRNSGLMNESIDDLVAALDRLMDDPSADRSLKARLMMRLGTCLGSTGRLKEAAGMLERALPTFQSMNDELHMCITLRHMGMTELSSGATSDGIGHLEESLQLARRTGLPGEICSSLYWCAIAYRQTGDLERMQACTEEQVAVAEEHDLLQSRISAFDNLMRLYIYTTDYHRAKEAHDVLSDLAERTGNWAALSAASSKMGIIHLRKEEWESAVERFERCLTLTARTGNLRARCAALGNLAHAYLGREDTDSAMEYSMRLIDSSARIGFSSGIMSGYARMAYIFTLRGAWEPALDCLETQIEYAQAMGDMRNLSDGYATRSRILLSLDRLPEALEAAEEAVRISAESGSPRLLSGQLELRGRLLYLLGRPDEARADLHGAVDMTEGKAGRVKVAFSAGMFLLAADAHRGSRTAAEELLAMAGQAPDEAAEVDLYYEHWRITGELSSATAAVSRIERMLAERESPLLQRMLETLGESTAPSKKQTPLSHISQRSETHPS